MSQGVKDSRIGVKISSFTRPLGSWTPRTLLLVLDYISDKWVIMSDILSSGARKGLMGNPVKYWSGPAAVTLYHKYCGSASGRCFCSNTTSWFREGRLAGGTGEPEDLPGHASRGAFVVQGCEGKGSGFYPRLSSKVGFFYYEKAETIQKSIHDH